MKKLLTLAAAIGLVGTNAATLISCAPPSGDPTEIVIQTDPLWEILYKKVVDDLNEKNQEKGLGFTYKLKRASTGEEHAQIANKGVKDPSIADVFLMTFDQYQNYVVQNNLLDFRTLIDTTLLGKGEERTKNEKMYGIEVKDNLIIANDNKFAWDSVTAKKNGEQFIGMIPSNIENNIWVYDRARLGLSEDETKLVGSELKKAQKIALERNDAEITDAPTVENLIKINNALEQNKAMIKVPLGWSGLPIMQAMFHGNSEIDAWFKENSFDGVTTTVWQKKGTEQGSEDVNDYDSIFENSYFKEIYESGLKSVMKFADSMGNDMKNSVIGKSNDDQFRIQHTTDFKEGKISMSLTETGLVREEGAMLKTVAEMAEATEKTGWTDKEIGVSSASKIKLGNILQTEEFNNKYADKSLSPIAAGSGWAVKSTISKTTQTDNKGNKVTKQEAAMEFIKAVSQPENAADLARTAIGLTSYSENAKYATKELTETGKIGDRVLADAISAVTESYKNGDSTARPNTALFDLMWGCYGDSFRLGLKEWKPNSDASGKKFIEQFNHRWNHDKKLYVFG